ncbi:MAG TPA: hypothetical protein PLH43_03600 [Acetivibrio sp.]|nr:hypothetical protein [Acetivibrio sp.]
MNVITRRFRNTLRSMDYFENDEIDLKPFDEENNPFYSYDISHFSGIGFNSSTNEVFHWSTLLLCSCYHQATDNKIDIPSTVLSQASPTILPDNTSYAYNTFKPIIDAYAELEQSNYISFNEDIIGDSILTKNGGRIYNFGTNPTLMYAFYDINSDGLPELLIGANETISKK